MTRTQASIGVLALQGAFQEHIKLLQKASAHVSLSNGLQWHFLEVRTREELDICDGLIIPGGESTTVSLVAARSNLLEPLRDFVKVHRKPTWGTCAGLILLAESANRTKKGGQELIGGLDVRVNRNYFGRQVESFQADLVLPFLRPTGDQAGTAPDVPTLPQDLGNAARSLVDVEPSVLASVLCRRNPAIDDIRLGSESKVYRQFMDAMKPYRDNQTSPEELEIVISRLFESHPEMAQCFRHGLTKSTATDVNQPFTGIFIRAPVVEKLLAVKKGEQESEAALDETVIAPSRAAEGETAVGHVLQPVEVMATLPGRSRTLIERVASLTLDEEVGDIVAVRQGNVFGTSFHPELTDDPRIHAWWLRQVRDRVMSE